MAQTNDETFLKKGLSKTNYEIISELGFRADYDGEIRIALNKARLASLDDCELFLKRVQSENPYELTWGECKGYAVAITRALAELEAFKTSLGKEVLSRNKKVEG